MTESERHPILQAEALREKDKEIARLKLEIASLDGSLGRGDYTGPDYDIVKRKRKPVAGSKLNRKSENTRQKRVDKAESTDSIYFGAPNMANIIREVSCP